jgi:hypothetical protein
MLLLAVSRLSWFLQRVRFPLLRGLNSPDILAGRDA